MIDTQRLQARWPQIRGRIKEKWGQLTDADLQLPSSDIDAGQLVDRIQQRTGEQQEEVERILDELAAQAADTWLAAMTERSLSESERVLNEKINPSALEAAARQINEWTSRAILATAGAAGGECTAMSAQTVHAAPWVAESWRGGGGGIPSGQGEFRPFDTMAGERRGENQGSPPSGEITPDEDDARFLEELRDSARYRVAAAWVCIATLAGLAIAWFTSVAAPWVGALIGGSVALLAGAVAITVAHFSCDTVSVPRGS